MKFDPSSVTIQGDLSRNDAVQLCLWCNGRDVVEFGMGGSTLLLSRCAKSLLSFDTQKHWFDVTELRLNQIPEKSCEPQLVLSPEIPQNIPACDVLFVDGLDYQRVEWVKRFHDRSKVLIVHDSRSPVITLPILAAIAPSFLKLYALYFHIGNSNLLIMVFREEPIAYENWNHTEIGDRRASPETIDYVP